MNSVKYSGTRLHKNTLTYNYIIIISLNFQKITYRYVFFLNLAIFNKSQKF